MKRFFKYTLPVLALCALAACSEDTTSDSNNGGGSPVDPNYGKELIAFSQEGSGISRAGFTRAGFSAQTKVYMRIKAQDGGTGVRYAEATATASAEKDFSTTTHSNIASGLINKHSDLTYESGQERYWDDAFGRDAKLTVYAFAIPDKTDATLPTWAQTGWTQVSSTTNPNWYTASADDVTVTWPKYTGTNPALDQSDKTTWEKLDLAYSNNISSSGSGGCFTAWDYTNNYYTVLGGGQMKWVPKTNTTGETTGKFDQGHLVFNHAMSWIEINLKEGAGYNNSSSDDFKWSGNTTQNITLVGFNTAGTFNVSTGAWSGQTSTVNITKMYEQSVTGNQTTRQLYAYVVPGTNLYEKTTNVVEFEIDEGKYYVTGKQIAEAIHDYYNETDGPGKEDPKASTYRSFTTLEPGKHYVINLKVAKKGIDRITAAILNWEEVNSSDADADNTYPEFTLEDRGTKIEGETNASKFNIYRAAKTATDFITGKTEANYDWKSDYVTEGAATKTWNSTNSEWGTNWYWANNKTYYHFRAAGNTENTSGTPTISMTKDGTNGDYFTIHAGAIKSTNHVDGSDANAAYYNNYLDYTWGAPFKDIANDAKLTYSTSTGFDNETTGTTSTTHQISQAIGSTKSVIRMLLFHMTSQIFVNVRTTTDANSKVTLDDGATTPASATTVEILNFLPDGTVRMGDGLVTATGTRKDNLAMINGTYKTASGSDPNRVEGYEYGMVPQSLTYSGGTIGLRITTPDGNKYVVKDLSTCTGTVTTTNLSNPYTLSSGSNYTINTWLPNYQYTYTVTITKTGINRITAAVVPWETVTAKNIDINLEY